MFIFSILSNTLPTKILDREIKNCVNNGIKCLLY